MKAQFAGPLLQAALNGDRVHPAAPRTPGDRLVAAVAGDAVEEECGDQVRDAWVEEYDAPVGEVHLLDGARELLVWLRKQRLTVVLASSAKSENLAHYLDLLGSRDTADAVVTAEDAEQSKLAHDLVTAALRCVGGEASSARLLGASTWDVLAAIAVDVPTVCVLSGGYSESELRAAGAQVVVDGLPSVRADWQEPTS